MRAPATIFPVRAALLLVIGLSTVSAATAAADDSREFAKLVDRYLVEVMGIADLDAGAPPIQRGDAALKEMSAAGFRQRIETLRTFLQLLQDIDRERLGFDDSIDYRFLEGTLRADLLVAEKVQRWRQDPRILF